MELEDGVDRVTYVIDASYLNTYGVGSYHGKLITVEEARRLLAADSFISDVREESLATLMSKILGVEIPVSKTPIKMRIGDRAVAFCLLVQLPQGKNLTVEELEEIPYQIWLLRKVD